MNLKRNLYILKCRTHVFLRHLAEKILLQLSDWGWVYCHRVECSNNTDNGIIHSTPDLSTKRFKFSVSYVLRKIESRYEYWFETNKGKRIFTVDDSHHVEHRVSYRAELKAFFAHFSQKQRMWVYRNAPEVQLFKEDPLLESDEFKIHRCDFSQCRFAFEFSYSPELKADGMSSEVISESYKALENQLTSKVSEINKILTGADYDGEMMSPKKMPLSENRLCYKCGLPVFASAKDKYMFECLNHGELSVEEIRRVDPVTYEETMKYCRDHLEALIKKSCPQDSNL